MEIGIDLGCEGGDYSLIYKKTAWFYVAYCTEGGYLLLGLN